MRAAVRLAHSAFLPIYLLSAPMLDCPASIVLRLLSCVPTLFALLNTTLRDNFQAEVVSIFDATMPSRSPS